jgi:hypothetical protein
MLNGRKQNERTINGLYFIMRIRSYVKNKKKLEGALKTTPAW